jgi:hypothetical protein
MSQFICRTCGHDKDWHDETGITCEGCPGGYTGRCQKGSDTP